MMSAKNPSAENQPYAEQTALTDLLGNHPKVKILATLLSEGRDINISQIAEQSGMSRSTVYDHLDDLVELDVIQKTREMSGSPLYEINKESKVAKDLAQLEWDLVEVVASE